MPSSLKSREGVTSAISFVLLLAAITYSVSVDAAQHAVLSADRRDSSQVFELGPYSLAVMDDYSSQGQASDTGSPNIHAYVTASSETVFRSAATRRAFVVAQNVSASFKEFQGMYKVENNVHATTTIQTVANVSQPSKGDPVVLRGQLQGEDLCIDYKLHIALDSAGQGHPQIELNLEMVQTCDGGLLSENSMVSHLLLESPADESVFGFGTQYSVWDMKGRVVPIITSEQGVGRGLEPLSVLLDIVSPHQSGNWHTTYTAVPMYMTSSPRCLFLQNSEYVVFDLTDITVIDVAVLSTKLSAKTIYASSPIEMVEKYTEFSGRQPPLPEWIMQGAIIGYFGGTEQVVALHEKIKSLGIQITGFWLQDWSGLRTQVGGGDRLWWNWEVDDSHYPGWDDMVANFSADGVHVFTYINPYLASSVSKDKKHFNHDYFKEAASKGFLVKNESGDPYILYSGTKDFSFGMIDFTNEDAVAWYKGLIHHNMIERGHSGWMADFGEYLPFDGVLDDGSSAYAQHNAVPGQWAKTNHDAIASANATSKVIPFHRSASPTSPSYAALFWLGDQLVTWDLYDGLQSALLGRLTSTLSGFGVMHGDVGGYTQVKEPGIPLEYCRDRELLIRWMEFASVADMIFRSHQGNMPERSVQLYTDNNTLTCMARFAELHNVFGDYKRDLMSANFANGTPIVRSMWLQYPNETSVRNIISQFLLGDSVLMAPVMSANTSKVDVVLPPGDWIHLWSAKVYSQGTKFVQVTVQSPISEPAVFYKKGWKYADQVHQHLSRVSKWDCIMPDTSSDPCVRSQH